MEVNRAGFLLLLSVALILSSREASAWSNLTYTYVCDEAVKYVWGSEVLNRCVYSKDLSFQKEFCGVILQQAGDSAYQSCTSEKGFVHPAVMPAVFFADPQLHVDYTVCPIKGEIAAKHLCSSDKRNPALEQALKWFKAAEDSTDECTRVYAFCIGSNYMADSYNPLNHLLYGVDKGACGEILDKKTENRILEPSPVGWSISQVCSFKYMQEKTGQALAARYAQDFMISNKTFADLIANLTAYGNTVLKAPYRTTTTVVTTTTESSEISATMLMTSVMTVPSSSIPTTTTMPVETDSGGGWFTLLVVACILIVVGYVSMGRAKPEPRRHTLGGHEHHERGAGHVKHDHRMSSLRHEGHEEGIISEEKSHSRLGKASGSKGGEE